MQPGIVFLPHGNLHYSQLRPERRASVARQSYRAILDLSASYGAPLGFAATGETLEALAAEAPDVLDLLKTGIREGRVEPVGAPHTHLVLASVDPELGLDALRNGLDTWERLMGVRPVTGWNPVCSWAGFVPEIFREAGYETLVADGDAYLLARHAGWRESAGLAFDGRDPGDADALARLEPSIAARPERLQALFHPSRLPNGLTVILRTDMMGNVLRRFLRGTAEPTPDEPVDADAVRAMLARWRDRIPEGDGFLLPYADDAEHVGTSGSFHTQPFAQTRFFEPAPEGVKRFGEVLRMARALNLRLMTPREAVATYMPIDRNDFASTENGCAWHGGTVAAWSNTPHARLLDPVCRGLHVGVKAVAKRLGLSGEELRQDAAFRGIMRHLASAWAAEARWPSAPGAPGRGNVQQAVTALVAAQEALTGIVRERGLAGERSLYSTKIMRAQIDAAADELLRLPHRGEKLVVRAARSRIAAVGAVPLSSARGEPVQVSAVTPAGDGGLSPPSATVTRRTVGP